MNLRKPLVAQWWTVEVPKAREGQILNLSFVDENGPMGRSGGVSGVPQQTERVKVFVFDQSKETIRFAIIGKTWQSRGGFKNELRTVQGPITSPPLKNPAKLGDFFIKSGPGSVSMYPNKLEKDEIGLTLMFRDSRARDDTDDAAPASSQPAE